jgi:hypothetical protein
MVNTIELSERVGCQLGHNEELLYVLLSRRIQEYGPKMRPKNAVLTPTPERVALLLRGLHGQGIAHKPMSMNCSFGDIQKLRPCSRRHTLYVDLCCGSAL